MQYRPHPYQIAAQRFIVENPEAGLLLDMGLGKTVITLSAIDELIYDRLEAHKVLVIAPKRVAESTWPEELNKWDHLCRLRYSLVLGSPEARRQALAAQADIYLINRENVVWLVLELQKAWPFDMVIIDELSSFKSAKAQRFKALRRMRPKIRRCVGLTGTPAANGLLDLWAQMYLLDMGKTLGRTLTGYRDQYFDPDQRNATTIFSWKLKRGAEGAIHERLRTRCLSMRSKDYLDLPEVVYVDQRVDLPPEALKRYRTLERDMYLALPDAEIDAGTAAILTNKLLQAASGCIYDENGTPAFMHSAKLDMLEELIESANGQPVLVYYAYKHELARLLKRFPQAYTLDGQRTLEAWNRGEIPILLAQPQSAGYGLNLQAGGHLIVWFGLTWSLEQYQQANARIARQGQTDTVIIQHLLAAGTVDERVIRVLQEKDIRQSALLEAVKARIKEVRDAN